MKRLILFILFSVLIVFVYGQRIVDANRVIVRDSLNLNGEEIILSGATNGQVIKRTAGRWIPGSAGGADDSVYVTVTADTLFVGTDTIIDNIIANYDTTGFQITESQISDFGTYLTQVDTNTLTTDDSNILSMSEQDLTFVSSNLAKLDEANTFTKNQTISKTSPELRFEDTFTDQLWRFYTNSNGFYLEPDSNDNNFFVRNVANEIVFRVNTLTGVITGSANAVSGFDLVPYSQITDNSFNLAINTINYDTKDYGSSANATFPVSADSATIHSIQSSYTGNLIIRLDNLEDGDNGTIRLTAGSGVDSVYVAAWGDVGTGTDFTENPIATVDSVNGQQVRIAYIAVGTTVDLWYQIKGGSSVAGGGSGTDDQTASEVPLADVSGNWGATNLETLATETADSLSQHRTDFEGLTLQDVTDNGATTTNQIEFAAGTAGNDGVNFSQLTNAGFDLDVNSIDINSVALDDAIFDVASYNADTIDSDDEILVNWDGIAYRMRVSDIPVSILNSQIIGTGNAADGYVATADGLGGVAWEVQTGGFDMGSLTQDNAIVGTDRIPYYDAVPGEDNSIQLEKIDADLFGSGLAGSYATDGYVLTADGSGGAAWEANGSSVSFGTDNQIPITNSGGTDFDYSANFVYDNSNSEFRVGGSDFGNYKLQVDGSGYFTGISYFDDTGNIAIKSYEDIEIEDSQPRFYFDDTDATDDFFIQVDGGDFLISNSTEGTVPFQIDENDVVLVSQTSATGGYKFEVNGSSLLQNNVDVGGTLDAKDVIGDKLRDVTQSVSYSASIDIDTDNGASVESITLTGNINIDVNNVDDGQSGVILLKQDGTGGHSLSTLQFFSDTTTEITDVNYQTGYDSISGAADTYSVIEYKRIGSVILVKVIVY